MHTQDSAIPDIQTDITSHLDSNGLCNLLIKKSVELGCEQAFVIHTNTIVVARWVQLKCKYGCDEYGKKLTCPPHAPTYEEMKKFLGNIIKHYSSTVT